jgi:hypothetical protein
MNPLIQLKNVTPLFLAVFVGVCLVLSPRAQAVSPPPDGGYAGGNTAEGQNALLSRTTGGFNTALGWLSLRALTTGSFNTGVGAGTLVLNSGDENTATGVGALLLNTTGGQNTANGALALFNNTEGVANTANGVQALYSNTTGGGNTANGALALLSNTTGDANTAIGYDALLNNTSGCCNTAMGSNALPNNTGFSNTAMGGGALFNNTTGSHNTALGESAGIGVLTANQVICIGTDGQDVSNSCYIGQIYSNVQPIIGTDPDIVTITSGGRLGRGNVSSRRYKHDIKPMDKASEVLFALKPVSFRYNKEYDATQTLAFGLIAEEVVEVCPDLVGRNDKGQPESVRYEQVNAMLLNEFLKEHKAFLEEQRKVEEQEAAITQLKSTVSKQEGLIAQQQKGMELLTAQFKEQAALIQKVSAQFELGKPELRAVLNDQ